MRGRRARLRVLLVAALALLPATAPAPAWAEPPASDGPPPLEPPPRARLGAALPPLSPLRGYLEPPAAPLVDVRVRRLGLRLQALAELSVLGIPYAGGEADRTAPLGAPADVSSFAGVRLERARLGVAGLLPLGIAFVVRGELGEEPLVAGVPVGGGRLLEALLGWAPWPELRVSGGVAKVPFGRAGLLPAAGLLFSTRGSVAEALTPARRLGGTVEGDLGLVTYAVGAYAGRPGHLDPLGAGTLIAGRFEVLPLGPVPNLEGAPLPGGAWYRWSRLVVGAGGLVHLDASGLLGYSIVGDVQYVKGPFAAGVAVHYGTNVEYNRPAGLRRPPPPRDPPEPPEPPPVPLPPPPPPVPETRPPPYLGGSLHAGAFVWPRYLEVALRLEVLDAWTPEVSPLLTATGGLNGYLFGRRLRARAAYAHRAELSGQRLANDAVLVSLEASF